jgi:FtsP/CotA-like multicopper oxidase with cupredoxin domain
MWIESLVIAPAERYTVETRFDSSGAFAIENRVQAINHRLGVFFPEVDTLGLVRVGADEIDVDYREAFETRRVNADVRADIAAYRAYFDRPVDYELTARLETDSLPPVVQQLMRFDAVYFNPVEWSGTMPMMNWASTGKEIRWILEDRATGLQNHEIDWQFRQGDVVKIRLSNDRNAFHAMQHPIHIHGQRFLVLERDGVPNRNLVWKDTMILTAGSTADIVLELSNPGTWMVHCHIAEHLESGMKTVFTVINPNEEDP